MSRIFLSHSSLGNLVTVALQQWMAANGWEDVFFDIDQQRNLGGRALAGGQPADALTDNWMKPALA